MRPDTIRGEPGSWLLHVSPAAVWAWPQRAGRLDASAAQRFADVEAALAAARGMTVQIGLAGRLLHTDLVGPGAPDPDPGAPGTPPQALAAARARWIQRLGPEAADWPLALGLARDADAHAPSCRLIVAWHGRLHPTLAPAAQLERWQAAARRAGVRLTAVAPWWALWTAADPRPPGTRMWVERDGAMLHLTRVEADAQGLHTAQQRRWPLTVRQRRWPLRPAETVAAALARLAVEDGTPPLPAAGWIDDRPALADTGDSPPDLGFGLNATQSAIGPSREAPRHAPTRFDAAPDFLRPLGPATPWPRTAQALVALAGVAALASLADLAFTLHAWRAAGAELAQWQQLEERQAQRQAIESPRGAMLVSAGSRTQEANARRAAWAVQRELDHPWAAMGTAWQAAPAQDPGLRWLTLEHSQPVPAAGSATASLASWRASAQVRRPEDALALADALGAAAPWQSVRVQRLEPLAAAAGWRFELQALWPLAAGPTGSAR